MIRILQSAGPTLKIILASLLVIICASMVITLVPGYGSSLGIGGPPRGVVATVGDQQVTVLEVQRQARDMVRQQFPRGGEQAAILLPYFASQAAERLINTKALIDEAHRMGLHVNDDELLDDMQHGQLGPILFPEGKFIGQEQYQDYVERTFDMPTLQFEGLVKDDILVRKLRSLIASGAFVSEPEIRQEFQRRNTKVKFDYAVLTQTDILKEIHPSEAELKSFYDHNKASYNNSIPEKRKVDYAIVDSAKMASSTTVSPQDLQAYYDQHRDEYRQEDQVKVRQIQFNLPLAGAAVDQKGVEAVRKKAEDVLKQVKAGGDFGKLALQYSDDPGSKKNGGELGWLRHSQATGEFGKAVFSLPKGQTSGLVNSGFAFHIIQVEDKQDAHVKTLAEVKNEIEEKVKQEKGTRMTEAAANSLLNQARTQGIDKAAAAKGFQPITTDFISRTDNLPGLGAPPQFMDAVFAGNDKAPPDVVQVPQGYVVYQVLEIKPPATPTFDEIRSRVETEFKNQRAGILLQQKTQELSDRAKADHDLKKAAKELGATMKTSDLVLPDGQVPDVGSMSGEAKVLFTMKPGEISGPISTGANGVVAQLLDKQQPTDQDYAAKKDEIQQSLLQSKQEELFGLFVSNLRKDMEKRNKLKINQEELKSLTRRSTEEGS